MAITRKTIFSPQIPDTLRSIIESIAPLTSKDFKKLWEEYHNPRRRILRQVDRTRRTSSSFQFPSTEEASFQSYQKQCWMDNHLEDRFSLYCLAFWKWVWENE